VVVKFFETGIKENKQKKILIVEDDKTQILITEQILRHANLEVKSITKGEEVLEFLDSFKPDLILMDLYLDGITGDKLVQVIRKEYKNKSLPIVFLTADTSVESRMKVLNAGADDLLTKPIDPDLLVAAICNRMQRSMINKPQIDKRFLENTTHEIGNIEQDILKSFFEKNINNPDASIIWLKVRNNKALLKKIGLFKYRLLCQNMFKNLPSAGIEFSVRIDYTASFIVLASNNLNRNNAIKWVEEIKKWLTKNYFSVDGKDYYVLLNTIILSDIPTKTNKEVLIQNAENIFIDNENDDEIILLEEGIEEKHFHSIQIQIENAIKTRNFYWLYQPIISTQDESQEIYQLMLRIKTSKGDELVSSDFLDIAKKTGLLRVLDRFTLEHAIRMIRAGEQKNITSRTLLNQILSDYQSKELRAKKLAVINQLKLPLGSIIFQFSINDAIEYISSLAEVGRDINQARIKICLSNFDCSSNAWKIARKLNVSWIRLSAFDKNDPILDSKNPENLSKVIRKAQILGYKVFVSTIESAGLAADLWKLNIDYLQGNFIQTPVENIFSTG
jgi:DNA-binding response OmpR family regulator/EAL domain-containing protein (putative c-di-GMP-specific phosphodiesterase class I)